MLHLRCGDDILGKLKKAGLPGRFARWVDPLCEGPTPEGLSETDFRAVRAAFIAERYELDYEDVAKDLKRQDARLAEAASEDETVLWFEHDLFDQLILVHLLNALQPALEQGTRISLVAVGAFPGVPRFVGLGQLAPEQLANLFPIRRPVTAAQADLAAKTWAALRAPDPGALMSVMTGDTRCLPFLKPALRRYFQEYPWVGSGVSLTERRALEILAGRKANAASLFRTLQDIEEAPWQGDTMLLAALRELARDPAPLIEPFPADFETVLSITALGRSVLRGEADWRVQAGHERWMGGVRLGPGQDDWRWDPAADAIVLR